MITCKKKKLTTAFLDSLADSLLDNLICKSPTYRCIGLALQADLSFNVSFDRPTLKNLGHWLGLLTLVRNIAVSDEVLPLWDIVNIASHKGSQVLLLGIYSLVAQILMAGLCSTIFHHSHPWVRGMLSLLARLRSYPHVGLCCVLEIEILNLQLSDFQPSVTQHFCNHRIMSPW